jgi:hypothetical protein
MCLSVNIHLMCVCQFTLLCLTSGFRFIFATLFNSESVSWTAVFLLYSLVEVLKYYSNPHFHTKIYSFSPKLPENCNFLLYFLYYWLLAIKKLKNLICNIVFKHLMLKKFGFQRYVAGLLGEMLHFCRGAYFVCLRSRGSRWMSFKILITIHPAIQCYIPVE